MDKVGISQRMGRLLLVVGAIVIVGGIGAAAWGQDVSTTTSTTTVPSEIVEFEDTTGIHKSAIDTLNADGVFVGTECAPRQFCPDDHLPRWVMAVWLVRVVGDETPDAITSSRFSDVIPSGWWAPYVEALADLNITDGCAVGPARYCPYNTVSRSQMATFLTRAFQLDDAYRPTFGFVDTVGSTHEASIDALACPNIWFR